MVCKEAESSLHREQSCDTSSAARLMGGGRERLPPHHGAGAKTSVYVSLVPPFSETTNYCRYLCYSTVKISLARC